MRKKLYTISTIVILMMAILQLPLVYYYTFGVFAFFVVPPYIFVALSITFFVMLGVANENKNITKFHKYGAISSIVIGALSLVVGDQLVEKLDWELRKNSRNEIVNLIKNNQLPKLEIDSQLVYDLDKWSFPPISNGGNQLMVDKSNDGKFTITFFINNGFLDHYSAFVYTQDPEKIKELESHIIYSKEMHINKKMENNWYRVSY